MGSGVESFFCIYSGADDESSDCSLFVSHQTGEDLFRCGSSDAPCQTLHAASLKVKDGEKIGLDGRDGESHTYSCERVQSPRKMRFFQIRNNMTIQGWRGRAHISCIKPLFAVFKHSQDMTTKLILANLALRNHSLRFRLSTFNAFITNCTFMNSQVAFAILQNSHSPVSRMQSSSLMISDSEFLNNTVAVLIIMFQGEFTLNISRCIFQGEMGRFNGTSWDKTSMAAVYVKLINQSRESMVQAVSHITDSVFRELGQENNGFALSFLSNGNIFTYGTLRIFNTTFLHNKNVVLVAGGLDAPLENVKIDSTNGNAIRVDNSSTRSSSLVISDSEFLNNSESVFVVLNKGVFTLNISRCIFQGEMGRCNGTPWDKTSMAAVYSKSN